MPTKDYKSLVPFSAPRPANEDANGRHRVSNGMYRVHKILSPEEVAAGKTTHWAELEIRGRNISPELWKLQHLTALFLCNNHLQRIPPQISQLTNLQILDLSNNKLRSLPAELGDMISLQHLYLNNNLLRVLPFELGRLFRLQTLGLHGNPLSPEISQLYREPNGTQKLLQFFLDHLLVNVPAPPERLWVPLHRVDRDKPFATFTVMCYNVLCEKYASSTLYSYCPSWALSWDYRKKQILQEIKQYEADVITLQEVETEQYRVFFKPELETLGYQSIFSPKSRAKTMAEDDRKFVDGCAIFWKADKYEFHKEHLIEFTQLAIAKADGSEHMLNRVMTRDNIGLAAVLTVREGIYGNARPSAQESLAGTPFVVCTAHIHWDPEFCDVKLVQCMMLVQELNSILESTAEQHGIPVDRIPILVCGDLNSLPESGVYDYLTAGRISADHSDFKDFRGQTCLQKLSSSNLPHVYTHRLKLESAYDVGMLPFTNYTCDFKGVIDYVFASPVLYRLGVLGAPDVTWFQEHKIVGCPYPNIPSDHIPLLVQYMIFPPSLQHQRTFSAPHLFNR